MSIGNEDIDSDHRYLILLINTVELVLRHPEKPEHVLQAFDELDYYARRHFDREERIQIAWGYIHYDEHKVEHQRLLDALAALRMRVETAVSAPGGRTDELAAQSGEISTFLRHWLIDHVMKTDMKLAELFRKRDPF